MAENNFNDTVNSLFKGMDGFLTTKTVVGEAVQVGNTILVPLADVSFGVGAGAFKGPQKQNAAGGLGAKISPCAILVINDCGTRIINVRNQDILTKVIDMVPDLISKFTKKGNKDEVTAEELQDIIDEEEKKDNLHKN